MTEDSEKLAETIVSLKTGTTAGDLPAGDIVATKYKIVGLLGKGGMGSVYRVHQIFLQQDMALKVLSRSGNSDDVHVRRFHNEGKAAFHLNHPNLVKVHDFGLLEDQSPYLIMDLVSGATVAEFLKRENPPINDVVKIISQACLGLAYAHQNSVVHRDVKPSNIMLVDGVPLGEEGSVKIVDFGIAKVLNSENEMQTLTQTGEVFGSPFYMSPEQCSGAAIDLRTDVYSLGCVLFEALTGTPPHVGNTALRTMMLHQSEPVPTLKQASMGKEFPPQLEAIVHKMLEKVPAARYQNLGIVANELANIGKEAGSFSPLSAQVKQEQKSGPDKKLIAAVCAIAMAAAGFLIFKKDETAIKQVVSSTKENEPNDKKGTEPKESIYTAGAVITDTEEPIDAMKMAKYTAAIQQAKPFIPIAFKQNGVLQYKIEFPECRIGVISNHLTATKAQGKMAYVSREAKGTTLIASPGPYSFKADMRAEPQTFANPSLFGLFSKTSLNELSLGRSFLISSSPPTIQGELESFCIEKILKIAKTWKNLELLTIEQLPLTKQALLEINSMQALNGITLTNCNMMKEISQQPFVQQLKSVALFECDADGMLEALSKSKKIESISLKESKWSAESLKKLQHCPRLHLLGISTSDGLTDTQLIALTDLKQIEQINFGKTHLTDKQLEKLGNCKHIKFFKFSSYSKEQIRSLTKDSRFIFDSNALD